MIRSHRPLMTVLLILLVAVLFRAWLIAAAGVSFDSDEAVVGLMARHINQGQPIPTFFYGQDYMGSLDAILVAGGFQMLGESVHVIRAVQVVLYLLALVTAYWLAYTLTRSRRVAAITLLLLAVPTAVGTLYTTITLGGYNEIVLLGNVVLLLGWQITVQARRGGWRWGLLGLAAGVGWWCNGAIATACIAAGLVGLRYFSRRAWRGYALAAAGFLIGSGPWWVYNLRHDWAALDFLTGGFSPAPGVEPISPGQAAIALLLLGLPALYGLRFPWEAGFSLSVGVAAGAVVYLILVTDLITGWYARLSSRRSRARPTQGAASVTLVRRHRVVPTTPPPDGNSPLPSSAGEGGQGGEAHQNARRWVWLVFGVFIVVFVFSSFSDATGRYLMPVWVPAAIGVALGLERLRRAGWIVPALALGVLLTMQAGTVIRAAHTNTGLTPQLVERLRTPAEDDKTLLDFLAGQGYTRGYASYWTSFRVMFRAHETVIFDTSLPYDDRGVIKGDNRYQPYIDAVAGAERVVWITQNFPELDVLIAAQLADAHITYRTHDIGRYRVYDDFSERVVPADFELDVKTGGS
jgi:hypothetical protein